MVKGARRHQNKTGRCVFRCLAVGKGEGQWQMNIINWFKYWGQLFLLPVYWMSFLVPRDKKLWLFGSTFGRRFADNPKYLYLYVSQHKKRLGVRPVWISHDKRIVSMLSREGYEAYYYHSLKGIWMALRGKVYIFDNYSKDINFWQSGGAVKVNLWHGIPLKKIQADNLFDSFRHPKNPWEKWKNFPRNLSDEKPHHYVLATSDFIKPAFVSAFRTRNVIVNGYPRNDSLFPGRVHNLYTAQEERLLRKIHHRINVDGMRVVCYMPTFRKSETKFFEVVDMEGMESFLEKNNLLLCIKLHPKSKLQGRFKKLKSRHTIVISAEADPYVFLGCSSVLVTDYSSIYFDYLLTGRPVVFFCYDLEEYLRDERAMYFNYREYTPGRKACTSGELMDALQEALGGSSVCQVERKALAKKMFRYGREEACPVLVEKIKGLAGCSRKHRRHILQERQGQHAEKRV